MFVDALRLRGDWMRRWGVKIVYILNIQGLEDWLRTPLQQPCEMDPGVTNYSDHIFTMQTALVNYLLNMIKEVGLGFIEFERKRHVTIDWDVLFYNMKNLDMINQLWLYDNIKAASEGERYHWKQEELDDVLQMVIENKKIAKWKNLDYESPPDIMDYMKHWQEHVRYEFQTCPPVSDGKFLFLLTKLVRFFSFVFVFLC